MIRNINAAHKVLLDYVSNYRFSFAEEEFYEQNPEERIRTQFEDDQLWVGNKVSRTGGVLITNNDNRHITPFI